MANILKEGPVFCKAQRVKYVPIRRAGTDRQTYTPFAPRPTVRRRCSNECNNNNNNMETATVTRTSQLTLK